MSFEIGDRIPDRDVMMFTGKTLRLQDLWRDGPVFMVFLRHYACPLCREYSKQLAKKKEDFDRVGLKIVLVGMGTLNEARNFHQELRLPFNLICDRARDLYGDFGVKTGGVSAILNVGSLRKGIGALIKGEKMSIPRQNPMQMSGFFLISAGGILEWKHISAHISDCPDPDEILSKVVNLE